MRNSFIFIIIILFQFGCTAPRTKIDIEGNKKVITVRKMCLNKKYMKVRRIEFLNDCKVKDTFSKVKVISVIRESKFINIIYYDANVCNRITSIEKTRFKRKKSVKKIVSFNYK